MFVFTSYKTIEVGVNSFKYGFVIKVCAKTFIMELVKL